MEDSEDIDAYAVNEQLKALKIKFSQLELKKKESELGVNKNLTELKSLRSLGKQWTEASRAVYTSVFNIKTKFDTEIDEVTDKVNNGITEAEDAIERSIEALKKVNQVVADQKKLIREQKEEIAAKTIRIENLETDLKQTSDQLEYLTMNMQVEIESLCGPMRDQVSNSMFGMMKEKVTATHYVSWFICMYYWLLLDNEATGDGLTENQGKVDRACCYY